MVTKEELIDEILQNQSYSPKTHMIEQLRLQLSELSEFNLYSLNLLINIKIDEARLMEE